MPGLHTKASKKLTKALNKALEQTYQGLEEGVVCLNSSFKQIYNFFTKVKFS